MGISLKAHGYSHLLHKNICKLSPTIQLNFSNGQSIGIVLYGMCSHSLYKRGENWQKLMQQLYANHMHILISWRKHTQSFKSVREVALTTNTHCLYIQGEKWLSLQCLKSDKTDPTIMCNPHAHPHTMKKTHAKFQNNWYKTVRGVALTTSTHCLYIQGEKWLSSQCRKSNQNWSNNYIQSICTSSYHKKNTCKVWKQLVQNCKRSCAHKTYPLSI